jgi:hypothetical protein
MAKTPDPRLIVRVAATSTTPVTTKPNAATVELIGSINQTTGVEEVEKVLVINPK